VIKDKKMRLGEIKKNISKYINEQNQIVVKQQTLYGGQAYKIEDYSGLMNVLNMIYEQDWTSFINKTYLDNFKDLYDNADGDIQNGVLTSTQYSNLSNYISQVNSRLPIYWSILDTMVEEQDEFIINIKLSEGQINSLEELNKFNKELSAVFKNIIKHHGFGGDVKFVGFDTGTSWYKMLIVGAPIVYGGFMGCLDIAEKLITIRKEWYESESIKLSFEMQLEQKERSKKEFDRHIDKMLNAKKEEHISDLFNKLNIQLDGNEQGNSISIGIDKIIELIEKGNEIHPSLNLPEYIEIADRVNYKIDYEKIKLITIKKNDKPKKIENLNKVAN
jgi:hypothetical protein